MCGIKLWMKNHLRDFVDNSNNSQCWRLSLGLPCIGILFNQVNMSHTQLCLCTPLIKTWCIFQTQCDDMEIIHIEGDMMVVDNMSIIVLYSFALCGKSWLHQSYLCSCLISKALHLEKSLNTQHSTRGEIHNCGFDPSFKKLLKISLAFRTLKLILEVGWFFLELGEILGSSSSYLTNIEGSTFYLK